MDFAKFSLTLDQLVFQLQSRWHVNLPPLQSHYQELFERVRRAKELNLVPKKSKSPTADLIETIGKSLSGSSGMAKQLSVMLSDPKIQFLIGAYDIVAEDHCTGTLPDLSAESLQSTSGPVKLVQIVKESESLGASVKCDANGDAYVVRLSPGGAAEKSGSIAIGDRVLTVNGVPLANKSTKQVGAIISATEGNEVTLQLVPAPFINFLSFHGIQFVRSFVDYFPQTDVRHPNPEAGLIIHKGDILEILNIKDRLWVEARNVQKGNTGLIPTDEQFISYERPIDAVGIRRPVFEAVSQVPAKSGVFRTVVLIGPQGVGRYELKRRLLAQKPNKYATTVPHTSRSARPHERDGVDYNFVSREQMELWLREGRFIESGEYNGNIYGTLDEALLSVIARGQVPVINAHPLALEALRSGRFCPVVIFIAAPEVAVMRSPNSHFLQRLTTTTNHKAVSEQDLEQLYLASQQLELAYGHLFNAKIVNDNLDAAFGILCATLHNFETLPCWVPTDWIKSL